MPVHKCGSSVLCLHELGSTGGAGMREDDASDFEYLEVDPSGRYGRVIIHHTSLPYIIFFFASVFSQLYQLTFKRWILYVHASCSKLGVQGKLSHETSHSITEFQIVPAVVF